uniref:Uncharacterized protein n=1 Tax=Ciona intestinalis TaxID=7719 RepID=H2XS93_CIOIN
MFEERSQLLATDQDNMSKIIRLLSTTNQILNPLERNIKEKKIRIATTSSSYTCLRVMTQQDDPHRACIIIYTQPTLIYLYLFVLFI